MPEENEENLPAVVGQESIASLRGIAAFLRNVKQEMKLVTRPSWEEVRSTTFVVLVFVFLFAFYLRLLDWIFSPLDKWIFSH